MNMNRRELFEPHVDPTNLPAGADPKKLPAKIYLAGDCPFCSGRFSARINEKTGNTDVMHSLEPCARYLDQSLSVEDYLHAAEHAKGKRAQPATTAALTSNRASRRKRARKP